MITGVSSANRKLETPNRIVVPCPTTGDGSVLSVRSSLNYYTFTPFVPASV